MLERGPQAVHYILGSVRLDASVLTVLRASESAALPAIHRASAPASTRLTLRLEA
jgi:hypothetical protein